MGPRRTQSATAMRRKGREGWLQRYPFRTTILLHAPTFCRMLCSLSVFFRIFAIVTTRNSKLLTATSATANQLPSPAKTRLTFASRLRLISRETPALQQLSYAEKTTKSFSSTRESAVQMKWVSCITTSSAQRFESSPSKRAHLLGSLSPLIFTLARFKVILTHSPYSLSTTASKSIGLRMPMACLREPVPSSVVTRPS